MVLNGAAQLFIYEIQQQSFNLFQISNIFSIQLPITNPSHLYICPLNPEGT
jgi:hypothetical protein